MSCATALSIAPAPARPPSVYAAQMSRLHEMAALPDGHPRRVQLRADLVVAFLPVVDKLARKHSASNRDSLEDPPQAGTIALITAIDRWDPELASGEFLGYLIPCVRGEMLRWFHDRTWSVRVPRSSHRRRWSTSPSPV